MATTTSPMTLEQWADTLNRNISDYFRYIYDKAPEEYSRLLKVEPTSRWFDQYAGAQGIAKPVANRDLEPIPQRSPVKSNTSKIIQTSYRSGMTIERLMIEAPDANNTAPLDNMQDFIESEKTLRNQVAADVYNNGFSVQPYDLTEADGTQRALFSTTHKREDNGATFSNFLNVALPPNLATMYEIIATFKRYQDNVGNFIGMDTAFTMLIPTLKPDWMKAADQICMSPDNPETADRAVNTLRSKFPISCEPINNFTSSTKWFVRADISKRYFPIRMKVFSEPQLSPLKESGNNPDAYFTRMRSILGVGVFGSARGVFGVGI